MQPKSPEWAVSSPLSGAEDQMFITPAEPLFGLSVSNNITGLFSQSAWFTLPPSATLAAWSQMVLLLSLARTVLILEWPSILGHPLVPLIMYIPTEGILQTPKEMIT